jgi:hypothetical protein
MRACPIKVLVICFLMSISLKPFLSPRLFRPLVSHSFLSLPMSEFATVFKHTLGAKQRVSRISKLLSALASQHIYSRLARAELS